MKKICILALSIVLTAAMFVGCGCTNSEKDDASTPTGMTETMPTIATTEPTTRPTTAPTQATTQPDSGNGALEDNATGASDSTVETGALQETEGASGTVQGRERGIIPHGGR